MPTIRLTESQSRSAEVTSILDAQTQCKVGYIAVLNFGFDRQTGERIANLEFVALPWANATAIAKKARKLSEEANCERSETSASADKESAGMAHQPAPPGPPPAHAGQPSLI